MPNKNPNSQRSTLAPRVISLGLDKMANEARPGNKNFYTNPNHSQETFSQLFNTYKSLYLHNTNSVENQFKMYQTFSDNFSAAFGVGFGIYTLNPVAGGAATVTMGTLLRNVVDQYKSEKLDRTKNIILNNFYHALDEKSNQGLDDLSVADYSHMVKNIAADMNFPDDMTRFLLADVSEKIFTNMNGRLKINKEGLGVLKEELRKHHEEFEAYKRMQEEDKIKERQEAYEEAKKVYGHFKKISDALVALIKNKEELSEELKKILEEHKEIKALAIEMASQMKASAKQQQFLDNMQGVSSAANALAQIAFVSDNADLGRFVTVFSTGVNILSNAFMLSTMAASLAMLTPISAIAMGFLMLATLGNNQDNNNGLLELSKNIGKLFNEMREDLNQKFAGLNKKADAILINQKITMDLVFESANLILANQDRLSYTQHAALNNLQIILETMHTDLKDGIEFNLLQNLQEIIIAIEDSVVDGEKFKTMSRDEVTEKTDKLEYYLKNAAKSNILNGRSLILASANSNQLRFEPITITKSLNNINLDSRIGMLADYFKYNLSLAKTDILPDGKDIINPTIWLLTAQAYLKLRENTLHFSYDATQEESTFSKSIEPAQVMLDFIKQLKGRVDIPNALLSEYRNVRGRIKQFVSDIAAQNNKEVEKSAPTLKCDLLNTHVPNYLNELVPVKASQKPYFFGLPIVESEYLPTDVPNEIKARITDSHVACTKAYSAILPEKNHHFSDTRNYNGHCYSDVVNIDARVELDKAGNILERTVYYFIKDGDITPEKLEVDYRFAIGGSSSSHTMNYELKGEASNSNLIVSNKIRSSDANFAHINLVTTYCKYREFNEMFTCTYRVNDEWGYQEDICVIKNPEWVFSEKHFMTCINENQQLSNQELNARINKGSKEVGNVHHYNYPVYIPESLYLIANEYERKAWLNYFEWNDQRSFDYQHATIATYALTARTYYETKLKNHRSSMAEKLLNIEEPEGVGLNNLKQQLDETVLVLNAFAQLVSFNIIPYKLISSSDIDAQLSEMQSNGETPKFLPEEMLSNTDLDKLTSDLQSYIMSAEKPDTEMEIVFNSTISEFNLLKGLMKNGDYAERVHTQGSEPQTSAASRLEPPFSGLKNYLSDTFQNWLGGWNVSNKISAPSQKQDKAESSAKLNLIDSIANAAKPQCMSGWISNIPTIQCAGENYVTSVYIKALAETATVLAAKSAYATLITGDKFDKASCESFEYFGEPSVYCEGEETTLVYTPEFSPKPLQNLDGQIALFAVTVNLFKKLSSWLSSQNNTASQLSITDAIDKRLADAKLAVLKADIDAIEFLLKGMKTHPLFKHLKWIENGIRNYQNDILLLSKKIVISSAALNDLAENIQYFIDTVKSDIFTKYAMPGDGNCLFHAISDQLRRLPREQITAQQLRQIAAEYIRNNPQYYQDTITGDLTDYVSQMIQDGQWGGEYEIHTLAQALKLCIQVIQPGSNQPIIYGDNKNPFIYLAYNGTNHYNSFWPTIEVEHNTRVVNHATDMRAQTVNFMGGLFGFKPNLNTNVSYDSHNHSALAISTHRAVI